MSAKGRVLLPLFPRLWCCCLLAAAQGWVLATIQDPYKPSNPWSKLYLMSWTGVLVVLLAVGPCNKRPKSI